MRPARHSPLLKHLRRLQPIWPEGEIYRLPENKLPNWVRLVGWIIGGLIGLACSPLPTLVMTVILSLMTGSLDSVEVWLFFPIVYCVFGPLSVLIGSAIGPDMLWAIGINRFANWLRK